MTRKSTRHPGIWIDTETGEYGYRTRAGVDAKTGKSRWERKGGFRRERDALDALRKVKRALSTGEHAPPSRETVAELFDRDLEIQLANGWLRPSTGEQYRRQFATHVAPAFGHVRAQELRPSRLDALYGDMRAADLAPSTVRQCHNMLSGVFRRAVKRGELAMNPCQRATPPKDATPEKATWSLPETQAFFAHELVRADADYVMWKLLAATGMRRGEALALGWDAVDLDAGVVQVRRNATLVGGDVVLGEPKTRRSHRRVQIGSDLVALLRDHRARQREQFLALGLRDVALVFPGPDGQPQNPGTVSRRFSRLVERTGLPVVSLHSLRHFAATLLLDQGQPVHLVASRLGHDASVLLRRYAHAGHDSQDTAAALESLLDSDRPTLRVLPGENDQHDESSALPNERTASE
jgi:integrase